MKMNGVEIMSACPNEFTEKLGRSMEATSVP